MLIVARLVLTLAVFFLTTFAATAIAQDFVLMKNGDRISGEVKKIWSGEIFIEPEYGDEYAIELKYVSHVHTDDEFEVEFRQGRRIKRVLGRLDLDEDGNPQVIVNDGSDAGFLYYPLAEIDNMAEVEEFFDWELRSDLSANISKGNTDTSNIRFYTLGGMKLGEHRHQLEIIRDEQKTDGALTKDQSDVKYQDMWTYTDKWFVLGSVGWTRDPIKELEHRTQIFLGLGYHFWDDSKRTLNLSLGPNYVIEQIAGASDDSMAVAANFRYEQKFFRDDLVIFQKTDYSNIVSGRENKVLRTSTGFRFDVTDDIYVSIQADYDYESNPATDSKNDDLTYLMGIGVQFD